MKKKKPAYSVWNNLKFVFATMWECSRGMTVSVFCKAPFVVASSFLTVFLSKEIVGAVTKGTDPSGLLIQIGVISLILLICLCGERIITSVISRLMMLVDFKMQFSIFDKCLDADYAFMESTAGQNMMSKAFENVGSDSNGARQVTSEISGVVVSAVGIASYGVMLGGLNQWILLTLVVTTVAGFFFTKRLSGWIYRNKDQWKAADRKHAYIYEKSRDFTRAKDMRLYGMTGWFKAVLFSAIEARMFWCRKEARIGFTTDAAQALLALVREAVSYGGLVFLMFVNGMPAEDFVLYFGIIGGLSQWLLQLSVSLDRLYHFHLGFSELREFEEHPDESNRGKGARLPRDTFSVEFKNVCYRYPGSSADTIKDLSLKIGKGEKLALVGLNGAGKTTVVKLLCGLYKPDSGEITIDGIPIHEFNQAEYFTLISAVFQDIFVLPQSVARNVSIQNEEDMDLERVENSLRLSGLWEKIVKLPKGVNTRLLRSVYDDSIDLSGGELQKLALARALYKGGKLLVLDEPTAALDPIAESRIYEEYDRMTEDTTSLFISHRLASTRFCDRIIFLEHGRIAECGSHHELMGIKGKYFAMFEMQSHYYKEVVTDEL